MAADNVVANAGSGGATFRTFSDGTNEWPASAVCFVTGGSAGAWTLSQADTNSGNKSAATLRVVIATDQPSLTNALTVTANAGTGTFTVGGTVTANIGTGNLAGITGTVTVQGGAASGATAAGNPVQAGGVFNTTQPTVTTGQAVQLQATARGGLIVGTGVDVFHVTVDNATVAVTQSGAPWSENVTQFGGSAIVTGTGAGGAGIPRVTVSNDSAVKVWDGTTVAPVDSVGGLKNTPVPTSNQTGPTMQRVKAAASTNATSVKASAGQIYGWSLYNNASLARYFKLYNKASAPTVGTDTPFFTIIIPASGGTNVEWPHGIPMGTGIAFAITGGVADSDTTAVSADDVHGALLYK